MQKINEKIYTTKEVLDDLDQYLDSSSARLRVRFRNAWKKQVTARPLTYAEAKI
jgi:hypothetical protein